MAEKTTVTENKKKALDDAILKIEKSLWKRVHHETW